MNEPVVTRLEAMREVLMAHFRGSAACPSAMKGAEREILVQHFLSRMLPPTYRFGRGAVIDDQGHSSGQVDIVMESPFGLCFPLPTVSDTLYPAEAVTVVIEVKSDLSSQWNEVQKTVASVRSIVRKPKVIAHRFDVYPEEELQAHDPAQKDSAKYWRKRFERIPCYAVGYRGFQSAETLESRFQSTDEPKRPDGALVIESGSFVGVKTWTHGIAGLLHFVTELLEHARQVMGAAPEFRSYVE